jgi:hypothetical protein
LADNIQIILHSYLLKKIVLVLPLRAVQKAPAVSGGGFLLMVKKLSERASFDKDFEQKALRHRTNSAGEFSSVLTGADCQNKKKDAAGSRPAASARSGGTD